MQNPEGKILSKECEFINVLKSVLLVLTTLTSPIHTEFEPLDIPLSAELQEYVYYASIEAEIDHIIIFSIMQKESSYNSECVHYNQNRTTDVGLMQINSCNWEWLSDMGINVHDDYGNIDAGIYMISKLLDKYTLNQALAAYNAGEGGMKQGRGFGYAESVRDIMNELYQI